MANFRQNSRYTGGSATKNRANEDFLVLRRSLELKPEEGDLFITVTQQMEKRPDLLSEAIYGDPKLWWVIYEFNGIRDPFFELLTGQQLRIPEFSRVQLAISNLES